MFRAVKGELSVCVRGRASEPGARFNAGFKNMPGDRPAGLIVWYIQLGFFSFFLSPSSRGRTRRVESVSWVWCAPTPPITTAWQAWKKKMKDIHPPCWVFYPFLSSTVELWEREKGKQFVMYLFFSLGMYLSLCGYFTSVAISRADQHRKKRRKPSDLNSTTGWKSPVSLFFLSFWLLTNCHPLCMELLCPILTVMRFKVQQPRKTPTS